MVLSAEIFWIFSAWRSLSGGLKKVCFSPWQVLVSDKIARELRASTVFLTSGFSLTLYPVYL